MIYTVTLNPSLDYTVEVKAFKAGLLNRTEKENIFPGGKGINVSIVLKSLGYESTALGYIAGFTGQEIERLVKEAGIKTDFIRVESGLSRINVKLKAEEETEINGMGPDISEDELKRLYAKLDLLTDGDILVLSGSVPKGLPATIYKDIMVRLAGREVKLIVDAAGDLLLDTLKYRPFLIKPNNHELGALFDTKITTGDEAIPYAQKLKEAGARNVLVSLGAEGAILVTEDGQVFGAGALKGQVINSVGAGDSMVAGFIAGYLESGDYEKAFKMGLAAGSASAFSKGLAGKEEISALMSQLN